MKSANIIRLGALAILTGAALNAVLAADSEPPKTVKTTDGRELKLVWNDEFNGEGLPDAKKWNYEVGYIRNNESQYYTKARKDNIFQKDGVLTIRTIKEEYPIKNKPNNQGRDHADYTSACIDTRGLASWTYGRIETRAKLPKGKGIWPAIWMLGDSIGEVNWPKCGEIDIMEYVGHTPNTVHSTLHMHKPGGESWHNVSTGSNLKLSNPEEQPEERFYVYAVEWTPEKLIFLVDDKVIFQADAKKLKEMTDLYPFDAPHYLILNTAIGGAWGGEIAEGICPAQFIIDYVRVYQ